MNLRKSQWLLLGVLCLALIAIFNLAAALEGFVCLLMLNMALTAPSCKLRTTLSVPELLMDVLDAFKTEIPFMLNSLSTDFSSKTAVKDDVITAHVSVLPTTSTYDATTGFANGATAADALLADVPVTLDQFVHVPVKVTWLTQLASKVPLYKEAIRNIGYVLAKSVVDAACAKITAANFTHSETIANGNVALESLELLRTDLTTQKAYNRGRFGIVSSAFASALQNDPRVQSSLFYGQLNGDQGYRKFTNLSGFESIWEYPSLPTNSQNLSAFFGDRRSIVIANRRIDFSNAAEQLGVAQIMQFFPISDPDTGLEMTGVAWQQPGTGDVYVSAAVLYGIGAGAQGGAADSKTDPAGIRVKTA